MAKKSRQKKKPAIARRQSLIDRAKQVGKKPLTANAKVILNMMIANNVKGNYKDYVIIAGKRIMDWCDSYDMVSDDGKTIGVDGMVLIHKSKLVPLLGEETARMFWKPGFGRVRRHYGKPKQAQ